MNLENYLNRPKAFGNFHNKFSERKKTKLMLLLVLSLHIHFVCVLIFFFLACFGWKLKIIRIGGR